MRYSISDAYIHASGPLYHSPWFGDVGLLEDDSASPGRVESLGVKWKRKLREYGWRNWNVLPEHS